MVDIIILPNGLRIVLEKIGYVRSISFGIWVKTGSRNENIGENGISHFIEHMFFKGTQNRSAEDIASEMDAIGGQLNAYTTKEYTAYFTRILDDHFDIALDIMSDMFFNSKFNDGEIEKERNVILEEIAMYEDTPEDLVHDILQSAIWRRDSLGYPILGTAQTISSFDNKKLKDYYENNYCPENTIISIAGNFNDDEIIKEIEKYFLDFKREKKYISDNFNAVNMRAVTAKKKDIEQLHICLSFSGLKASDDDAYTLSALNTLFGGGMSSKLFQSIRENKGLVYSIYSYAASYADTGILTIYEALNPTQCEAAVRLTIEEIKKIKNEKISEKIIYNTKEQMKSNYILSLENTSSRMSNNARAELILGRILSPDEIMNRINSVTSEDVYRLANKIFDLDNMSLSAVGKIQDFDFERMIENGRR